MKTNKKIKFLFVGGTIYRKGIDLLLKAYAEQFTNKDDVCLVIKDLGNDSYYSGQNYRNDIERIKENELNPEIEYIDSFLSEKELAGLYRSCNVLVHPFRGEGFGMPILEAMACGLPVMVTNGGAPLDFCNDDNSLLIDATKVCYKEKKVGEDETVDHPWMFEASLSDLKNKMKYAVNSIGSLSEKSKIAYNEVHSKFTWNKIVNMVENRLYEILDNNILENFHENEFESKLNNVMLSYENKDFVQTSELIAEIINDNILDNINDKDIITSELFVIQGYSNFYSNYMDKAHECFEKALKLNPNSTEACYGLGEVFSIAEMYEESKTMLEWAVNNDQENANAINKLKEINKILNLPVNHNSLIEKEIA